MENSSIELGLMDPEEKALVDFILDFIPEQDRNGMTADQVLMVLDLLDDYLEDVGLMTVDERTGECNYLEGEVDETEQLQYVLSALKEEGIALTSVQVQLIQDAEYQFGVDRGWYAD